jgi:hypothetical protein
LQQVLGSDTVKQLAARFNIPVDQITKALAQTTSLMRPRRQASEACEISGCRRGRAISSGTREIAFIALKNLQIRVFAMP